MEKQIEKQREQTLVEKETHHTRAEIKDQNVEYGDFKR